MNQLKQFIEFLIAFFISIFLTGTLYAQEFLVYDETRTFTESEHGFHYFENKIGPTSNWSSPDDYYNGTWYFRYEVLNIPSNGSYRLSTCIWADWNYPTSWKETCHSPTAALNGTGVFMHSSSPRSWWKKGGVPVDFSRANDIWKMGVVLWGSDPSLCNVSDWVSPENCWDERGGLLPLKIRVTIVAVANGNSFSGWNNYVSGSTSNSTEQIPPSAPSNLTGFSSSSNSVSLSWKDNSDNESGFRIERRNSGTSWSTIASLSANTTSYVNNGVIGGQTYEYRIRSFNSSGNSGYSNTVNVTVKNNPATTTSPPVTSGGNIFEAENNYSKVNELGSSGSIYVAKASINSNGKAVSLPDAGDEIAINFNLPSAGTYSIKVWLRSGYKGNSTGYWPGDYAFNINGIGNVSFNTDESSIKGEYSSYGGSSWGFMTANVYFSSGGNKVLNIKSSRGWAMVDYIQIPGATSSTSDPPATTTSPPVTSGGNIFEAENNYSKVNELGSSGSIYVAKASINSNGKAVSLPDAGDEIAINFNLPSAGTYSIKVWLRSGYKENSTGYWPGDYAFNINGIGNVSFNTDESSIKGEYSSYGGSSWGFMTANVYFSSGGNKVLNIKSSRGWAMVDYIQIPGATSSTSDPPATTTSPPVTSGGNIFEAENNYSKVNELGSSGSIYVAKASINSNGKAVSLPDAGDEIAINFNLPSAGTYSIKVWLRSGYKGNSTGYWPGDYAFNINGIGNVSFNTDESSIKGEYSSYGGSSWGFMTANVYFSSGGNKVLNIKSSRGWAMVDYIQANNLNSNTRSVNNLSLPESLNQRETQFLIYPNPVPLNSILNVKLDGSDIDKIHFQLQDLNGKILVKKIFAKEDLANSFLQIDISKRIKKSGFYILQLRKNSGKIRNFKLLVE